MGETSMENSEKKEQYEYREYPKNVRQIGIPLPGTKVYLEDYVITYLKQCFVHTAESKIVILLGKDGEDKVEEDLFVYGAVALEGDNLLEEGVIKKEIWDQVYSTIHENFSGAKVMGWVCGVPVWNSRIDQQVRRLQKKEFARENQVLFLWDLGEKEEKMFLWHQKLLKELSGYYVYFEKNPQMREFMLDKPDNAESIDGDYQDVVTDTMRHVIGKKEEQKRNLQILSYGGIVAAGIAIVFGVYMMLDSTARIKKMEETVSTLSEYVGEQQEDVQVLSNETEQIEKKVTEIPFENKETPTPSPKKRKTVKKKTNQSYLVQKGDTLSQIVWRQYHDLSYEATVKEANGLKNGDEIYVGQCLVLPQDKK